MCMSKTVDCVADANLIVMLRQLKIVSATLCCRECDAKRKAIVSATRRHAVDDGIQHRVKVAIAAAKPGCACVAGLRQADGAMIRITRILIRRTNTDYNENRMQTYDRAE